MSESTIKAKQVLINKHPEGVPVESDFRIEERELPALKDGELSFQSLYISPDPYQRGKMLQQKPGDVMVGSSVARVLESKNPDFKKDDLFVAYKGWVSHGILTADEAKTVLRHDPSLGPASTALGVLGMPGMTAYFGLLKICDPKPGEVVVVSGAAGAVGSIVGQIAKIKGAYVVGVAGGKQKCDYIKSLGFDATIDYKEHKDLSSLKAALDKVCPEGVDCFFDNVGGPINDAVMMSLKQGARISICGQISQYNAKTKTGDQGPRLIMNLIYTNAKIEGFICTRWASEWGPAIKEVAGWIKEGKIKYQETIDEGGIEATPKAFISLFSGGNTGKQLVKL